MTMSGGSKAVMWIEDGDDLLLCGIPTDRTVRINERLAVTISLEATSART